MSQKNRNFAAEIVFHTLTHTSLELWNARYDKSQLLLSLN